jgi:hypothetical protein
MTGILPTPQGGRYWTTAFRTNDDDDSSTTNDDLISQLGLSRSGIGEVVVSLIVDTLLRPMPC